MNTIKLENIAYRLRVCVPLFFRQIEKIARGVVSIRFGRHIKTAEAISTIHGIVQGWPAVIRPLTESDLSGLKAFLDTMPDFHLKFFHPHDFDEQSLIKVLRSRAFLNYGLFINDELTAYGLLKVSPTGSGFMGQLVSPDWCGRGLGRYLVAYLYWQASIAKLRPRATISCDNKVSLHAHASVADYRIVAELPNNYLMIEFPGVCLESPALYL